MNFALDSDEMNRRKLKYFEIFVKFNLAILTLSNFLTLTTFFNSENVFIKPFSHMLKYKL